MTKPAGRVLGVDEDPTADDPADSDTLSEGIGMLGKSVLGTLSRSTARRPTTVANVGGSRQGAGEKLSGHAETPSGTGHAKTPSGTGHAKTPGGTGHAETPSGSRLNASGEDGAGDRPGKTARVMNVGVGEARTGLVGNARINSAAYARVLDGRTSGKSSLTKPIAQLAPPSHAKPVHRTTPAGQAGPVKVGGGALLGHAQWNAGMACGSTVGEAARSSAAVSSFSLLDGALVRVPGKVSSLSSTALERRGGSTRTVASATVAAGRFELVGGKVKVKVLRPPTLLAGMSAGEGGEVRYVPALVEVSGDGISPKQLSAAGDHIDITLSPERHAMESSPLTKLPSLGGLRKAEPMPLPTIPGLPQVAAPEIESASALGGGYGTDANKDSDAGKDTKAAGGTGTDAGKSKDTGKDAGADKSKGTDVGKGAATGAETTVRVALGDVRQSTRGHSIAAKATAIKVTVAHVDGRNREGYGGAETALTLGFGLLDVAAVAPEKGGDSPTAGGVTGAGGGLPITGPRLGLLVMGGAALFAAGAAVVFLTVRRRRHFRA